MVLEFAGATPVNPGPTHDAWYEVSVGQSDPGLLRWGAFPGSWRFAPGIHCYEARWNARVHCDGCPVFLRQSQWPRIAVFPASEPPGAVRFLHASLVDHSTALVRTAIIPKEMLRDFLWARLDEVAQSAGLSSREQQVLELLVRGHGLSEIAGRMRISVRTVRFHQGNIVEKVGADSRSDIVRLLF